VLGTGRKNMPGFISPPFTTSSLTPSRIPNVRQQRRALMNFYNGEMGMFKSDTQNQKSSYHHFLLAKSFW
jgi:hypothetical protein